MASFDIKRRNGEVFTVLVDDEDLEAVLAAGPWAVAPRRSAFYVQHRTPGSTESLHRFLIVPPVGWVVDHINRNALDNRRENLRIATPQGNQANRASPCNATSGFKGVSWHRPLSKWRASIKVNDKSRHLGYFDSREEAHEAYCRAAVAAFGDFARFK